MASRKKYRVSVDHGGTYVDAVCYDLDSHVVHSSKSSTTPSVPVEGVMKAHLHRPRFFFRIRLQKLMILAKS